MKHFRRSPVCQAADLALNAGGTATGTQPTDPVAVERARTEEIVALGRAHSLPLDQVHGMIQRGLDIAAARGEVLANILARGQGPVASLGGTNGPDLTDKEKRKYSFLRALQAQLSKDWAHAGFEREVSNDIAKRQGKGTEGFFVPNNLPFAPDEEHLRAYQMLSQQGRVQSRAPYLVGTAGQGGNLVATNLLYESFVEVLRNQLVTALLGARYLTGLVGGIDIPRQISQTGGYWVGESSAPTESEATFDKVSLRPKTVGALSKMSRLMLLQATPAIEMLARQDMLAVIGLAIDLAALSGSGSSNQPTGIVNQSGVGSVVGGTNGANLSFDNLIQLKYATKFANAPQGAAAFAMNSKAIGYLSTLKATTGQYLWDPQGGLTADSPDRVKGSPYAESQQLRSTLTKGSASGICSELVYGNWQELFIAMWGVTEVMVNPYDSTGFTTGDVLVRAFQTCDIGVRHGASFSVMSDALTPGF
jgi:HK97 family phage major capsid protein